MSDVVSIFDYTPYYRSPPTEPATVIFLSVVRAEPPPSTPSSRLAAVKLRSEALSRRYKKLPPAIITTSPS